MSAAALLAEKPDPSDEEIDRGDGGQHLSLRDIPARTRRHPPRVVDEEGQR